MRLLRLELRRYGHLADTTLDFSDGAALSVVHGPNEAGKSTALAAIADALFGIEDRTAYAFRYPGPQLRLAMALQARDGGVGHFVRRKGRKDTLLDAAEAPVPEESLRRFLGGATRDLFEQGFGLDGARLRAGGLALLQSDGDVGGALMAGSGIGNLRMALQGLDEEARALVNVRGKPRLQEAIKVWRAAQGEAAQRAVQPAAWRDLETTRANARERLALIRDQSRALATEQSRLQRARRVLPLLRDLAEAQARLAGLGEIRPLPADAQARRLSALSIAADATRDVAREMRHVADLVADRDRLARDAAVLAEQDGIDALSAESGVMAQALADLPGVRARVAGFVSATGRALRDIGAAFTPEAARDAIPLAATQSLVRELIGQRFTLDSRLEAAEAALAEAVRRRDLARLRWAATPAPASASLLRRTVEAVRAEGPIDAACSRAARDLADAEAATSRALASLPLWNGTLEALLACPVPLVAETDALAARMTAAAGERGRGRDELARLDEETARVSAEIEAWAGGAVVPTPAAIRDARAVRDRAWNLVRRGMDGDPAAHDRAGLPEGALPDVFEALRDAADGLADRAADDAGRVAGYLGGMARLGAVGQAVAAARATHEAATAEVARLDADWAALWAPCGVVPAAPDASAEWRRKRDAVVALAARAQVARGVHADLRERVVQAVSGLDPVVGPAAAGETVADRLLRAEDVCATAEASVAAYDRLGRAVSDSAEILPGLEDAVAQAGAAIDRWRVAWADAAVELGLAADASTGTAEAALSAWGEIAAQATAWREDERRIADMQACIDGDTARLDAVLGRLGHAAGEEAAVIAIARLARRLVAAREAEAAWVSLDRQIRDHEAALAVSRQAAGAAAGELALLCGMAGVADDAGLASVIARARDRDDLVATLAALAEDLRAQGDGRDEAALRAETDGVDVDAAKARLDEIEELLTAYGGQREEHSALSSQAESGLARMRDGNDAASKAQEAEDALAEARAAAERYGRVHVARVLLRAGIERFRRDNQGPLLRAAGRNFAMLTGGRYVGLGVDEDDKGHAALRAIRDDATECPVQGLSEGTRDQLFLALRVAVVEAQAASGERLPFVADDLLVHFDDARAATAIHLLLQLGRTTQVILFTHHDHIAALARAQDGVCVQRLARSG